MNWLKDNHRSWQPAALAAFAFGLLLPLSEMIRLHPYEYTHFNHIAGTVRTADNFFMLDYWGLALKQASDGLREELVERQEVPPRGANGRSRYAARNARRRWRSAPTSRSAGTARPPTSR